MLMSEPWSCASQFVVLMPRICWKDSSASPRGSCWKKVFMLPCALPLALSSVLTSWSLRIMPLVGSQLLSSDASIASELSPSPSTWAGLLHCMQAWSLTSSSPRSLRCTRVNFILCEGNEQARIFQPRHSQAPQRWRNDNKKEADQNPAVCAGTPVFSSLTAVLPQAQRHPRSPVSPHLRSPCPLHHPAS